MAVTLDSTDHGIMETKDSPAGESNLQIARGCLGIETHSVVTDST